MTNGEAMVQLNNDWDDLLRDEFQKEYYLNLREFLKTEYSTRKVYPPMFDIFNALRYTSRENTRIVILGQDPYHGAGQAYGLCFSVKKGETVGIIGGTGSGKTTLINLIPSLYQPTGGEIFINEKRRMKE